MKIEIRNSAKNALVPGKPSFYFIDKEEQEKFSMLGELYMCDTDYILNEVLPNIEKIWNGEKYWDSYRSPTYGAFDSYEFGYDATIIDFYKDISIINYNYFQDKMEVSSQEIYQLMTEWGHHLREWRDKSSV
jgi:hypothetical protein